MIQKELTSDQRATARLTAQELAAKIEASLLDLMQKGYGEVTASVSVQHGNISFARSGSNETFKPSLN